MALEEAWGFVVEGRVEALGIVVAVDEGEDLRACGHALVDVCEVEDLTKRTAAILAAPKSAFP